MATLCTEKFVGTSTSNVLPLPYDAELLTLQIEDSANGTTIDLDLQGNTYDDGSFTDLTPEGASDAAMEAEGIYRFDVRGLRNVQISGDTSDLVVTAVVTG